MTSRWRRACIAAGAALALVLTAGPAQAATANPATPDQTSTDPAVPALPDPAIAARPDPADPALPDPADPAGPADLGGDVQNQAIGLVLLRLTLRTATGTFGTAATGITFEPTLTGCRLTVPGVITFPGPDDADPDPAIVGSATAVTTASVAAPCADAQRVPPGTYADTFTCTGTFTGTILDVPVTAPLSYRGTTAVGGAINATLTISGFLAGASLVADGRVLQGGSYSGIVWA
ncbi:hypothetical protein [Nakamurella sp.]|uniref:hypothetical protein n=1 Tax=Nakamurella sp. TaxID=1869182 RepID=UPI003B3B8F45